MADQRSEVKQQLSNETIQNPPAGNLPPSAHKPDKKIIIGGIVIIVLALAAIGGGAYYFSKKQNHFINSCPTAPKTCADGTQINLAQPNCNEVCPEDKKAEGNETASWQTYRNEKYGYSFQFPADDFLNGEPGVESDEDMVNTCVYSEHSFCVTNFNVALSHVDEWGSGPWSKKTYSLPIKDIAAEIWRLNKEDKNENMPNKKVSDLKEISFAGLTAYEFNVTGSFVENDTGGGLLNSEERVIFVSDSNNKFQIRYPKDDPISQQIASTFKFNDTIDTSNWQTYRNEEYGFEVKILPTWENYSVKRKVEIDSSSWGVDKNGSPIIQGKVVTYIFELPTMQPDVCQDNKCLIFSLSVFSNEQAEKIDFVSGPFGPSIAKNDNFTFALTGTSQDPPLDLIKFRKDVNQILSTFKFIEPVDMTNWQTYRNEELGFEFTYPNYWENATTTKQIFSKDDVAGYPEYQGINLNKVAEKSADIRFDGKFCNGKNRCNVIFSVQEYDINRPLKLDCYEGFCDTINILEEKQRIESKSNIFIGGLKGEVVDGIFKPAATFTRIYTAVNPKYEISITAWYNSEGFIFDATRQIDLETIIKSNPEALNQGDLKLFLQNLNSVVSTFKFIK